MTKVYVALGANLDDPKSQLDNACKELIKLAEDGSFQVSSYYRSKPIGDVVQPDYINAVASFVTKLAPLALLDELQRIELEQGRQRLVRWGPRTLDLDLLLYGNQRFDIPRLTIPHYGLQERSFVLIPLYELTPNLCLPCDTKINQLITPQMNDELEII